MWLPIPLSPTERDRSVARRRMLSVPDRRFISFAQNAEDVVLWRALGQVRKGRYVEVGANLPSESSITRAFYDRGWTGIEIEPVTEFIEAFRKERPKDVVVQAAITDADTDVVTLHVIDGTGLSTLDDVIAELHRSNGWEVREERVPARRLDDVLDEHLAPEDDIHFLVVDAEGAERSVLATLDLKRWRPWVLVVEATAPNTIHPTHEEWEGPVLEAGYAFCLFDGLSRFYVAEEHAQELTPALSAPSNPLDDFVPYAVHRLNQDLENAHHRLNQDLENAHRRLAEAQQQQAATSEELAAVRASYERLLDELVSWRGAVLARWAEATSGGRGDGPPSHEVVRLRKELAATHATVSWRITAPLRAVQSRRLRGSR
jgi:FkbM family methyltransferase